MTNHALLPLLLITKGSITRLLVFCGCLSGLSYSSASQPLTLQEAQSRNWVTTQFHGNGASSGDAIVLTIVRLPGAPTGTLRVTVPAGTMLRSHSNAYQDMAIAAVRGRIVSASSYVPSPAIELPDNRPVTYLVSAYCANFERENPTEANGFSLGPPDPMMACLSEGGRSLSIAALQAAVWMHTDRMTYSRMSRKFSITRSEWTAAEAVYHQCLTPPPSLVPPALNSPVPPALLSQAPSSPDLLGRRLLAAAFGGENDKIVSLLDQGASVSYQESEAGLTPLLAACHKGHLAATEILLNAGANLRDEDHNGWTALEHALTEGHLQLAGLLLSRGFPVAERNRHGATHLGLAVRRRSTEDMKLLLDHGADPNQRDCTATAPLHYGAWLGLTDVVQVFLGKGADVNQRQVTHDFSPLVLATISNHPQIVALLVAAGADLSFKIGGLTALDLARESGLADVVATLTKPRSRLSSPKPAVSTMPASFRSDLAGCREAGPGSLGPEDLKAINDALVREAARGNASAVLDMIAIGADVNATVDSGFSAVAAAAGEGHPLGVRILAQNGADVNAKTSGSFSPITLASLRGHHSVVRELIAAGAKTTADPKRRK
ncbi:MAG: ankyrin repeat domain-containing protein [Bryobacterales bacterium]|nr:ankyrin repeat domain-containing protein [Bryobacterales bacterium]